MKQKDIGVFSASTNKSKNVSQNEFNMFRTAFWFCGQHWAQSSFLFVKFACFSFEGKMDFPEENHTNTV